MVSLATGGYHERHLARLLRSLERSGYRGRLLFWEPGRFPPGCPSHEEAPFAFKPACLDAARSAGHELVLWIDASCVVLRDLAPAFRSLGARGHLLFPNEGLLVGEWASDLALVRLGLTREEALRLPEVNAAAVGLDFRRERAHRFLDRWLAIARDGATFRGVEEPVRSSGEYGEIKWNVGGRISSDDRVKGHRHDQTVAGVLAARLGMELEPRGLDVIRHAASPLEPGGAIAKVRGAGPVDLAVIRMRVRGRDRVAAWRRPRSPDGV